MSRNTIRPNDVPRMALGAPRILLLTLSLRSVPPVRKGQEHRDAACKPAALVIGPSGGQRCDERLRQEALDAHA